MYFLISSEKINLALTPFITFLRNAFMETLLTGRCVMTIKKWVILALLGSMLTACGGGGSGVTSTASTANKLNAASGEAYNRSLPDAGGGEAAYVATGANYGTAQLSELNRSNFTALLIQSIIESYILGNAFNRPNDSNRTASSTGSGGINKIEKAIVAAAEQKYSNKLYQAKPISSTEACDDGGSFTLTGDLNDNTGVGTLDVNYGDCVMGNVIARGNGKLVINAKNLTYDKFSDFTFQYNDLYLYNINTNELLLYTGSRQVNKTIINGLTVDFKVQSNLQRLNHDTNMQTYDGTLYQIARSGEQISGVMCDNIHGCIDVSTRILLTSDWGNGEITMIGVNKSAIRVRVYGGGLYSEVDGEGDGSYGQTVLIYHL